MLTSPSSGLSEAQRSKSTASRSPILRFFRDDLVSTYHKALRGIETSFHIEFDSKSIKLLKVESRQGHVLRLYQLGQITDNSDISSFSSALTSLLEALRYKGEPVHVHLSFSEQVINKIVSVNLKQDQTTEQWILENREKVFPPTPDEEIAYDYFVLDRSDSEKILCLSIIKKERLNQIMDILDRANINVESISSRGFLIHSLLSTCLKPNSLSDFTVIALKDTSAELLNYRGGFPEFLAECSVDVEQIRKVLLLAHSSQTAKPKLCVLGEHELGPSLVESLRSAGYDILPTKKILENIESKAKELPESYWLLYSLYLGQRNSKKCLTSLLPPEHIGRFSLKTLQKVFAVSFKAAALSLLVLVILNLGLWAYLRSNQGKLERFESKLAQIEALQKENQNLSEKVTLTSALTQGKTSKAQLLYELSKLAPDSLWLREIVESVPAETEKRLNVSLELAGLTVSQEHVNRFLSNLESSHDFKDVKLEYLDHAGYQQSERIPSKYRNAIYRFKITLESLI
jgi:Tfp pilus assembly protein PilN